MHTKALAETRSRVAYWLGLESMPMDLQTTAATDDSVDLLM